MNSLSHNPSLGSRYEGSHRGWLRACVELELLQGTGALCMDNKGENMWWLPLNATCLSQGCAEHGPVHAAPMRGVGGAQRGARSEYAGATGESSAFSWALKEFGLDKRWGKSVESEVKSIKKETVIGKNSEGSWGKLFWKPMISSHLRNCPFCLCPYSNPSPGTQPLHALLMDAGITGGLMGEEWWVMRAVNSFYPYAAPL